MRVRRLHRTRRDRPLAGADAGRFFTVRAGSLIAWNARRRIPARAPFRIVGAHTDSPNLRVKQHPDRVVAGWQVVALQPYGGAWLNSWLDRDLGLSGRISVRDPNADGGVAHWLVRIDEPLLRVPQLAIHLAEDRGIAQPRPAAPRQRGLGRRRAAAVAARLRRRAGRGCARRPAVGRPDDPRSWNRPASSAPTTIFVSAPRLDNQGTCYAGLEALLAAEPRRYVPVLALFDHEEVGSTSDHGAQSDFLLTTLERIVLGRGR